MQKIILVLGGTGNLGRPVSYALKEAGFQVRILARNLEKARRAFDDSFELVAGDPGDAASLEQALAGCYGVHISLPTEIEQQAVETVAKVAPRQGVRRMTYISGATVADENRWFPMIDRKFLAEKAIGASGMPFTILCPTWVMESLPLFVNQGQATVLGKQPCPYHWVAAADIARMIAAAYSLGQEAVGRFIVHGPEAIDMQAALKRYCAMFHPGIREVSSMPFWLVKLLAAAMNNRELKGAGQLMAYFEKVGEGNRRPEINCILGAPTMTLDTWLQKRQVIAN